MKKYSNSQVKNNKKGYQMQENDNIKKEILQEKSSKLTVNSVAFVATILFLGYLFWDGNQFNQFKIVLFGGVYAFFMWFAFLFASFREAVKKYSEIVNRIEESRKNQEIELKGVLR